MNSKKLATKVAATAVVVLIPITTLTAGASAAPKHVAQNQGAINSGIIGAASSAWSSRLSGLPFGGAAIYDAVPYNGLAFYNQGVDPVAVKQSVPNAWSTRLSGLMFGGAALYL